MIDSFRAARWIRTLNLVLQAILFLTFIGGLNYLAGAHAWRKDLTRYRRYSLSPETLSYLAELSRPVHIVTTSDEKSDNPEVDGLLREYVNATEGNPAAYKPSGDVVPKGLGPTPPGVVLSSPGAPMLAGAASRNRTE